MNGPHRFESRTSRDSNGCSTLADGARLPGGHRAKTLPPLLMQNTVRKIPTNLTARNARTVNIDNCTTKTKIAMLNRQKSNQVDRLHFRF
jgi:hypothetical protein